MDAVAHQAKRGSILTSFFESFIGFKFCLYKLNNVLYIQVMNMLGRQIHHNCRRTAGP